MQRTFRGLILSAAAACLVMPAIAAPGAQAAEKPQEWELVNPAGIIEKAVRECEGFDEAALPIQHADNMQHAVELARAAAKPGDIIILSPASASFDLYPNFEVRGREFKKIVNALK